MLRKYELARLNVLGVTHLSAILGEWIPRHTLVSNVIVGLP